MYLLFYKMELNISPIRRGFMRKLYIFSFHSFSSLQKRACEGVLWRREWGGGGGMAHIGREKRGSLRDFLYSSSMHYKTVFLII